MKVVARLLDELVAEMRRTAESAGVDSVHDLRVSVRRATEALRIFEDGIANSRRLRKEIKGIREKAAAVRDRDVTRQLLRRHRLPVRDPAMVYLQGQRDLAAFQLQQFLQSQIRKDRPERWRRWIGEEE
ncbi:MAG: CHAD domain-containing protein [Bryobacteraceae bacterium]